MLLILQKLLVVKESICGFRVLFHPTEERKKTVVWKIIVSFLRHTEDVSFCTSGIFMVFLSAMGAEYIISV